MVLMSSDRVAQLEAENEALREEIRQLTTIENIEEIEVKIRQGEISLGMTATEGQPPGFSRALKYLAAAGWVLLIGEEEEEPPNYRMGQLTLGPIGNPELNIFIEVVKPDGKSSHQIRQELEAEIAQWKEDDDFVPSYARMPWD